MELFASNDALEWLEAEAKAAQGDGRPAALTALAWQLRQRDTRRALELVAQVQDMLDAACPPDAQIPAEIPAQAQAFAQHAPSDRQPANQPHASLPSTPLPPASRPPEFRLIAARLTLVRAEAGWLFGDLPGGTALAEEALQAFAALADGSGQADAHWLLHAIHTDRGDRARARADLEAMAAVAVAGEGDPERAVLAAAALARAEALADPVQAMRRWGGRWEAGVDGMSPAAACLVKDFWGMAAAQACDFGQAVGHWIESHSLALASGQLRRAILTATNIGNVLTSLSEHNSALDWMQRALDLARACGWPSSIGVALQQTGETLRQLQRLDAARDLLSEALEMLTPMAGSRSYAIVLHYLGNVELDRKQYASAIAAFQELERCALALGPSELLSNARRGQAHALSRLGQPAEALAVAEAALAGAGHFVAVQIEALLVLADIHRQHRLPPPPGMVAASASLHYLQRALDVAEAQEGYVIGADLFSALAEACADAGDYSRAYDFLHRAVAVRDQSKGKEATNRAIALQVQHQTERAQAESAHLRELAKAEARRAEVLQQTSTTLTHLSAVGQEITAHLDAGAVFAALSKHAHGMMNVDSFLIFLLEPDGQHLRLAYGLVDGAGMLVSARCSLSEPTSFSAKAVRERREVQVNLTPDQDQPGLIPGTEPTLSMLFVPLLLGPRVLGVMTVQSRRENAYGERDLLIFRTLCAYGAIALANADAMVALGQAQAQLAQQEKLASLGGLVAGVAHEVNTPLGVALTAISGVDNTFKALYDAFEGGRLSRSLLQSSIDEGREYSALARFNASRAAALVASFKAIAVQRAQDLRQDVEFARYLPDVAALVRNELERRGHSIEIDAPEGLTAHLVPEALTEALARILTNVLDHAFDSCGRGCGDDEGEGCRDSGGRGVGEGRRGGGRLTLSARRDGQCGFVVVVADNGCGIGPAALPHVFDPFFTTKRGAGGHVGLGLHVAYNQVTQRLKGCIDVASVPGAGTTVTLRLPG